MFSILQKYWHVNRAAKYALTALVGVVLVACTSPVDQQHSGQKNGEDLLFVGHDDGDLDIYLTNTLTGNVNKLTENNRDDVHPAWSKDGRRIAYASSEHGLYEIYVMDADGSNKQRITHNNAMELTPQWSPDGASLVYVSDRDGTEQLYRYDFASKTETALTSGEGGFIQPVYSNSGHDIAYLQRDGKKLHLNTMRVDGTNQRTLVDEVSIITMSWSPDSSQIAFSGRSKRDNNLYSVEVDSGKVKTLTNTRADDTDPVWLPNGESLIFLSSGDSRGQVQLFRLDLNGEAQPVQLSESGLVEMNISVSADGRKVGYVRYENRFFHTYVMTLETGATEKMAAELGRTQLTPSFRPSS
jgi:Tol biopolymer transport system component